MMFNVVLLQPACEVSADPRSYIAGKRYFYHWYLKDWRANRRCVCVRNNNNDTSGMCDYAYQCVFAVRIYLQKLGCLPEYAEKIISFAYKYCQ